MVATIQTIEIIDYQIFQGNKCTLKLKVSKILHALEFPTGNPDMRVSKVN